MSKTIGIYKITSPSGKVYIGQSTNIKNRFRQYSVMHSSGRNQIKLWRSFKKYGVDKHIFEIIEECKFENLNKRERYWQDFYDVLNRDKGLNLILTKTDKKPKKVSEETKEKMSKSAKGKKKKPFSESHLKKLSLAHMGNNHSEETKEKMRIPIIQLDKKECVIREFNSSKQAQEFTGILATGIVRVCKGQRKTAGGFFWKYKNEK